jgi:uncharacterized protein YcbX
MDQLRVTELWRYPVKSMLGERLDRTEVGRLGLNGDRAWSLVDLTTGFNLTARREPSLLTASARLAGPTVDDGVVITLPDGTTTADDRVLSSWIGRPVELRAAAPDEAGTYETPLDETEIGSWVQWNGPPGSFHDSTRTMVSLASTTTIGRWDRRRFRLNVILDGAGEDDLVGRTLHIGDVTLTVTKPIDRCVMVTRPQPAVGPEPALERDLSVLQTINRERQQLLGIAALVDSGGSISVGDPVRSQL